MFRADHALDKSQITVDEFCAVDHVVEAGISHADIYATIKRKGKLTVPHYVAVGHIIGTTDMITSMPERFARVCVRHSTCITGTTQ